MTRASALLWLALLLVSASSCKSPGVVGRECDASSCARSEIDASEPAKDDDDRDDDCEDGSCSTPDERSCDGGTCKDDEPYCSIDRGRCVECLESTQCGDKEPYCVDNECEECRSDADCSASERCRDGDCETPR